VYSSPNIIQVTKSKRMRWAGHTAHMGDMRYAYRVLVGRPERNRPLPRPWSRWDDIFLTYLQAVGRTGMDWTGLMWLRKGTGCGL